MQRFVEATPGARNEFHFIGGSVRITLRASDPRTESGPTRHKPEAAIPSSAEGQLFWGHRGVASPGHPQRLAGSRKADTPTSAFAVAGSQSSCRALWSICETPSWSVLDTPMVHERSLHGTIADVLSCSCAHTHVSGQGGTGEPKKVERAPTQSVPVCKRSDYQVLHSVALQKLLKRSPALMLRG